jgi:hypothetical protein
VVFIKTNSVFTRLELFSEGTLSLLRFLHRSKKFLFLLFFNPPHWFIFLLTLIGQIRHVGVFTTQRGKTYFENFPEGVRRSSHCRLFLKSIQRTASVLYGGSIVFALSFRKDFLTTNEKKGKLKGIKQFLRIFMYVQVA